MPQERITALKTDETSVEMTDVTKQASDIVQSALAPAEMYPFAFVCGIHFFNASVECVSLMAGLQPHLAWVRLIGLWGCTSLPSRRGPTLDASVAVDSCHTPPKWILLGHRFRLRLNAFIGDGEM